MKKCLMSIAVGLCSVIAGSAALIEVNSSISSEACWNSGNTYYVSDNISVGAKLTIEPGAVVKVASGKSINVGTGMLQARGTAGEKVILTSANDNSLGEIIPGSTGAPAAGDWNRLVLYGGNILEFWDIRYADRGVHVECMSGGSGVSLSHNVVSKCVEGVHVDNCFGTGLDVIIFNNLILDCVQGIQLNLEGGNGDFDVSIINNTINNCSATGVLFYYYLESGSVIGVDIFNNLITYCADGVKGSTLTSHVALKNNGYAACSAACTVPGATASGQIGLGPINPFDAPDEFGAKYLLDPGNAYQLVNAGYDPDNKGMPGFYNYLYDNDVTDTAPVNIGYHYPHPTTVGQEGYFTKLFLLDKADDADNAVLSRNENDVRYLCVDENGAVAGGVLSATSVDLGSGLVLSGSGSDLLVSQGAIFGGVVQLPAINLGGEAVLESFPTPDFYLSCNELNGTTITSEGATPLVGTIDGATFDPAGHAGGAFSFDGDYAYPNTAGDDFVEFPGHGMFAAHHFTIATWVELDDWSPAQSIFSTLTSNYNRGGWSFAVNGGQLTFGMRYGYGGSNSKNIQRQVFSDADNGMWHHVACTHSYSDGVTTMRLFLDGVPVPGAEVVSSPAPVYDMQTMYIGNNYDVDWPREVDGSIDEVKFFTRVLSDADIAKLYTESAPSGGVLLNGGDLIVGGGNSIILSSDSSDASSAASVRQVSQAKNDVMADVDTVLDDYYTKEQVDAAIEAAFQEVGPFGDINMQD